MAKFCFRVQRDDDAPAQRWQRAWPAVADHAPTPSGWHDSSFDLQQGLDMAEANLADLPLALWLACALGEPRE